MTTTTTRDDDAQKPPRIRPQRRNANRHTQRGMGMLEGSIERDGIIGALTVAADDEVFDGSARAETLPAMGFDLTDVAQVVKAEPGRVLIIESDGSSPLVHRRVDIPSADDPKAQRLGVAANRVAQVNLDFDPGVLAEVHDEAGLGALFFPNELANYAQPDAEPPSVDELWKGMPEFEYKPKAHKTISVHFANQEDYEAFARLINQTLTEQTSYIWYPYREKDDLKDLRYESGNES